jgi:Ulp1 family protease
VTSKEKEEVESVASKEKEDPYDFDQDMAASEEPPQESSDKEESDREKEGDDETSKTKKVKETVENGALEVSSTSSTTKKNWFPYTLLNCTMYLSHYTLLAVQCTGPNHPFTI